MQGTQEARRKVSTRMFEAFTTSVTKKSQVHFGANRESRLESFGFGRKTPKPLIGGVWNSIEEKLCRWEEGEPWRFWNLHPYLGFEGWLRVTKSLSNTDLCLYAVSEGPW